MRISRWAYAFASVIILILGAAWVFHSRQGDPAAAAPQTAPEKGFTAPDFTLATLDGQSVQLASLKGHPVILNFWASWCGPCQEEMPDLQTVAAEYAARGVMVVGVNMTLQDTPQNAAQFAAQHNLTFPVVLDDQGSVQHAYRIQALPTTFFIGSDGVIRDVIRGGPVPAALFRSEADDLLKAAP